MLICSGFLVIIGSVPYQDCTGLALWILITIFLCIFAREIVSHSFFHCSTVSGYLSALCLFWCSRRKESPGMLFFICSLPWWINQRVSLPFVLCKFFVIKFGGSVMLVPITRASLGHRNFCKALSRTSLQDFTVLFGFLN